MASRQLAAPSRARSRITLPRAVTQLESDSPPSESPTDRYVFDRDSRNYTATSTDSGLLLGGSSLGALPPASRPTLQVTATPLGPDTLCDSECTAPPGSAGPRGTQARSARARRYLNRESDSDSDSLSSLSPTPSPSRPPLTVASTMIAYSLSRRGFRVQVAPCHAVTVAAAAWPQQPCDSGPGFFTVSGKPTDSAGGGSAAALWHWRPSGPAAAFCAAVRRRPVPSAALGAGARASGAGLAAGMGGGSPQLAALRRGAPWRKRSQLRRRAS